MRIAKRIALGICLVALSLVCFLPLAADDTTPPASHGTPQAVSDHFDGIRYFNPNVKENMPRPSGLALRWVWNWVFRTGWTSEPQQKDIPQGSPPINRLPEGTLSVTPVGHATFLIQMDGFNVLTDPIWSQRCSPVSWVGPKRHHEPGIRFEDLPPIDVVLISHNHYDHLDLPTLKRLAGKGVYRSIVPLGNGDLLRGAGMATVYELDWWQSIRLSPTIEITLVPAQHFSSRTLRDRNQTLWGGFVISGASGNVFFAGDTGYGPHFREIACRFAPIAVALLPIAPFRPQASDGYRSIVHMGPAEAVQAHMDLQTPLSIAAHFQVFRLGLDGYSDAVDMLASSLQGRDLTSDAFIAPVFGQPIVVPPATATAPSVSCRSYAKAWGVFDSTLYPAWTAGARGSDGGRSISPPPLIEGVSHHHALESSAAR